MLLKGFKVPITTYALDNMGNVVRSDIHLPIVPTILKAAGEEEPS